MSTVRDSHCVAPRPARQPHPASEERKRICTWDSPALAGYDREHLCLGHRKRLTATIGQLDEAMMLLLGAHQRGSATGGEKVSGSHAPPIPVNLAVIDCQDRLADLVGIWSQTIAQAREIAWPRKYGQQTRLLRLHTDWLLEDRDASTRLFDRADRELGTWADLVSVTHQAISLVQQDRPARRRLPVRHSENGCGALAVFQDDGEEDAYCDRDAGGCGRPIAAEDLARTLGHAA